MEKVGSKQINKVVVVIMIAIAIYVIFLFSGDISKVKQIFKAIPLSVYLSCLFSALCGYVIRAVKWSYSLKQVGAAVPLLPSSEIFFIGTAFTITPGKLGELIKSYHLKKNHQVEISRSVPIVFADHLTTLIAWLIFIGCTFHVFLENARIIIIFFVLIAVALYLFKKQKIMRFIINLVTKNRLLLKYRTRFLEFYDSTYVLLQYKPLFITVLLSFASSLSECIPLYLLLKSLGNGITLSESIFIVALSTIAGTLSLIPGGIGVLEGSVIGLLIYAGVDSSLAISVSILERLIVLWFGVLIGLVILFLCRKRYLA